MMHFTLVRALLVITPICLGITTMAAADTTRLTADGTTGTYELINRTLAPGHVAVEVPDCGHSTFGPHITQALDPTLNRPVFLFHAHVENDDDRCKNKDRQRVEIKTYKPSPTQLKGLEGETFRFAWLFKLDTGFQSSENFTHLFQLKSVGGPEARMPVLTLTARASKNSGSERLEVRHARGVKQYTLAEQHLEPFLGRWLQVDVTTTFAQNGRLDVKIRDFASSELLFEVSRDDIDMWQKGAEFVRPKWGIYRSLKDATSLRDEIVAFNDFEIERLDR